MKRTILYAYIALMVAVGLPLLANLGEQDAREGAEAVNPMPPSALDEAPPAALPRAETAAETPAPAPAALAAPEQLSRGRRING